MTYDAIVTVTKRCRRCGAFYSWWWGDEDDAGRPLCGGCADVPDPTEDVTAISPSEASVSDHTDDDTGAPPPCAWCGESLAPGVRSDAAYCDVACRVAAHRARRRASA